MFGLSRFRFQVPAGCGVENQCAPRIQDIGREGEMAGRAGGGGGFRV